MNKKQGYGEVSINGKTYGYHLSMTWLHLVTELRGIDISEIGTVIKANPTMKDFSDMIYCGIKANCLRNEKPFPTELGNTYQFLDMLGESDFFAKAENLSSVIDTIMESRMFKNDENLGIPRAVKKSSKDPK